MIRFSLKALSLCTLLTPLPGMAQAQSLPETKLAQDGLQQTIAQMADNPAANRFELGMLQTLRAVEKSLQLQFEYGLVKRDSPLPVLRLGAGGLVNPDPKTAAPDTLSGAVTTFLADMAEARQTLDAAKADGVAPFDITLQDIWFDINVNGTRDPEEGALQVLGGVVLGPRNFASFSQQEAARQPLTIRFDAADHAWLTAYTHMLSGVGNLFMAFDPAPILADLALRREALKTAPTIPNFYDQDALRADIAKLEADRAEAKKQIDAINKQMRPLQSQRYKLSSQMHEISDEAQKAALRTQIDQLTSQIQPLQRSFEQFSQTGWRLSEEISAARAKLEPERDFRQKYLEQQRTEIDMAYVAVAALAQKPDAQRIRAAYDHWLAMIAQNRDFWALLAAETDDTREWIPNATQSSALPLTIPEGLAEAWQNVLIDAQAVLEGKLLLPHPLLPEGHGISLPAYVDNPAPLGLVEWVHGIAAYPYAAKGARIDAQSWRAFTRLAQGNAGGFAALFN